MNDLSKLDRGIIKWQPFNSLFNPINIIDDINDSKNRKKFPELSEDQIKEIEEKIMEAYNLKLIINLKYYYDGRIKNIKGKISFLNIPKKLLYLNNLELYFKQILEIEEI